MSSNLWRVDSNNVHDSTISGVTVAGNQESTDPLLYSPAIYDFHLTRNSTAIDGGLTLFGGTNDYGGSPARREPRMTLVRTSSTCLSTDHCELCIGLDGLEISSMDYHAGISY